MKHAEHKNKDMKNKRKHKIDSNMKTADDMPMMDMDAEMGNEMGMCKAVSSKS